MRDRLFYIAIEIMFNQGFLFTKHTKKDATREATKAVIKGIKKEPVISLI